MGEAVNRGEVWWVEHPEEGRRPVCILTRQAAIPVLRRVVVVPATRKVRGIRSEVSLGPADGMPDECVLAFDNVSTVSKALLTERITRLGPAKLAEVRAALDVATGC
jgi:mRNA interferase MazF